METCRVLAKDILSLNERRLYNIRNEYFTEVQHYIQRLPKSFDTAGSILLSDAAAINLNYLFLDDKNNVPAPFAAGLRTFLNHHTGLRHCYPELSVFYKAVRKSRLQKPLPMDAVSQVVKIIDDNTPTLFDPSVKKHIDQFSKDPVLLPSYGEAIASNQQRLQEIRISGNLNKLWGVFLKGESIQKSLSAWHSTYGELIAPMTVIIKWLKGML